MEIWYTMSDLIERKTVQEAIEWINNQLYAKPVSRLRFLLAANDGDIGAGISLYTYLKALPFEVETVCFGQLDASAVLPLLAGSRRAAITDTQFFFHEGRYTLNEKTAQVSAHEEAINVFRQELRKLIHIVSSETDNDGEVVAEMLKRTKIMIAQEAQEFGLIHEILKKLPLRQQEQFGFRERE